MQEGAPINNENLWEKTGQGVRLVGEEEKDPQSKIWLIKRPGEHGQVLNTTPPNLGTLTEAEALAYAKEKYPGEEIEVVEHHTSSVQRAEEI